MEAFFIGCLILGISNGVFLRFEEHIFVQVPVKCVKNRAVLAQGIVIILIGVIGGVILICFGLFIARYLVHL